MVQPGDRGILYKIITGYRPKKNIAQQRKLQFQLQFNLGDQEQCEYGQSNVNTALNVKTKNTLKALHTTKIDKVLATRIFG